MLRITKEDENYCAIRPSNKTFGFMPLSSPSAITHSQYTTESPLFKSEQNVVDEVEISKGQRFSDPYKKETRRQEATKEPDLKKMNNTQYQDRLASLPDILHNCRSRASSTPPSLVTIRQGPYHANALPPASGLTQSTIDC
jgi:hypothetical protein